MSKKTLKLQFNGDYDFFVAGLICGYKDYRLCFELNVALGLQFFRTEDVVQTAGRPGSSTRHSYFNFTGNDNEIYHIISNRDINNTGFYIPEMKNVDYFLLISGASGYYDFAEVIGTIRKINAIAGVYEINHRELKSAEGFLVLIEQ